MTIHRVWQATLSVLALGTFFALEYMRGMNVPSSAFVICSWVMIVTPWLLAVLWVVKRQYIRTLVVAALVAAARVSLDDTLSDFVRLAGWFLIGAIVLTLAVAVISRVWRRRKSRKPEVAAKTVDTPAVATATPPPAIAETTVRSSPASVPPPSDSDILADPDDPAAPVSEAASTGQGPAEQAAARSCSDCGAELPEDGASFCRKCGAQVA